MKKNQKTHWLSDKDQSQTDRALVAVRFFN